MSPNAHAGCGSTQCDRARTIDFPTFLARLFGPRTTTQVETAGQTLHSTIELFERVAQDGPLPARAAKCVEALRREFDRLRQLHDELRSYATAAPSAEASEAATNTAAVPVDRLDPRVEAVVMLNCWYIDAAVSRDAADAALTAMVKRHTRKKLKGRPPSIPPERLRDAKRLRERRLTHGQIARKLGLKDSKAVGSALRYHFPDEPSAKNSR